MKGKMKNSVSYILDISVKNKKKFYVCIAFSLLSAIMTLFIPVVIGRILESLTDPEIDIQAKNLLMGIIIFVSVYTLQGISVFFLGKIGAEALCNLQNFFVKHIMYSELEEINTYPPGDMASRATNDICEVSVIVTSVIPSLIKNVLIVVCSAVILWIMNSRLTIFIIVMVILLLIISRPVNEKLESLYKMHQIILGDIGTGIARCVSNMVIIKTFSAEKKEYQYSKRMSEKLKNNMIRIIKNETIWNVFLSCAMMADMVLVITFAKYGFSDDIIGTNVMSVYLLYMVQILSPATELINLITKLVEANGALQRITEVLHLKQEKNNNLENVVITNGNLKFTSVNFCYKGISNGLKNISIEVPAKTMVAVVGPSGVGKSTLFSLILRLYKEYEGKIEIDSNDIKQIPIDSIRRQVAYVSQSNIVVTGTVMDNLRYGKNDYLTPEEIVKFLHDNQMIQLFDDFSEGVYTDVGESGNKISEGQRQRINIARALMSNPMILLLDEITSSLDTRTEQKIMDLIEKQRKKTTIVMTAHRLNIARNADLIYVLNDRGEIEGSGTHQYLLKSSETYNELIINSR